MVGTGATWTLVVAGMASLFMAWAIGAGSSGATPFAPAVGANAISVLRAGFVVGLLGLAGAVLQGANVTEAVGRELVRGVALSPPWAAVALLVAAGLVAIGVFAGYPVATAFTVTGAVVGVGVALGGQPAWAKYREIVALWVLTPVAGGGSAHAISTLLRDRRHERRVVPALGAVVGVIVANVEFAALGPAGTQRSLATAAAAVAGVPTGSGTLGVRVLVSALLAAAVGGPLWRATVRRPEVAQRRFLLALGGLVAFSAGGSQVGLAIGPLLPAFEALPVELPLAALLVGGGVGLLAGSWTGAPRLIKALSQDYTSLGPRRSIAALVPSFAIAQAAVYFGIPVSFNEIIVSAIVGSGYAAGGSGVSRTKMGYTVVAWVGSLAVALGLGYGAVVALDALGT